MGKLQDKQARLQAILLTYCSSLSGPTTLGGFSVVVENPLEKNKQLRAHQQSKRQVNYW